MKKFLLLLVMILVFGIGCGSGTQILKYHQWVPQIQQSQLQQPLQQQQQHLKK